MPWLLSRMRPGAVDLLRGGSVRYAGPSLFAAHRLARSDLPIVLHHHHLEPRWTRVELALLRAADAVVAVSEHAAARLAEGGVERARVHVIPNGVSAPEERDPWPEAWPDAPGPRLLVLGRLEERKRPGFALAVLRALDAPARLVIAGDGPLRPDLERQARGLPVAFTGRVSGRDKWRLLDAADALLFPSVLEGFGIVAAEALVRGVPVVGERGTAVEEIVRDGETGGLATGGEREWAAAVRAVLARGRIAPVRFSWDVAADRLAALYADVASSRGRTSSRSRRPTASGR